MEKDLRNIQNVRAMKQVLVEKFEAEYCGFKYNDISIRRYKDGYYISIKDYNHTGFYLHFEENDPFFGNIVYINQLYDYTWYEGEGAEIFVSSETQLDVRSALLELGYHIANTF